MAPNDHDPLVISSAGFAGRARLVRLEGELDLVTAGSLRDCLEELRDDDLVLDMSGVTFTDSTGLATLVGARRRARRGGVTLRVRGLTGQTRALLERTGLLTLLTDEA